MQSRLAKVDAEVSGATGKIEHSRSTSKCQFAHCNLAPACVKPEGHDAIDEVVTRSNGVEHVLYDFRLRVSLRKFLRVPGHFV